MGRPGERVVVRQSVFEIEDYLQAADLGLFTSESESFCFGVLEAMWFGCPSVSTAAGGIPEVVVSGESGVLVETADAGTLGRAVESRVRDPEKRGALGRAARRRVEEKFSAAVIVPQYEALYWRVVAGPKAPVLH